MTIHNVMTMNGDTHSGLTKGTLYSLPSLHPMQPRQPMKHTKHATQMKQMKHMDNLLDWCAFGAAPTFFHTNSNSYWVLNDEKSLRRWRETERQSDTSASETNFTFAADHLRAPLLPAAAAPNPISHLSHTIGRSFSLISFLLVLLQYFFSSFSEFYHSYR